MTDDRPTKTCPDCAETVLEAARKCRFCGYRFDVPDSPSAARRGGQPLPSTPVDAVLGLLRRPDTRGLTAADLLADWNIALGPEEGEPTLCHGSIDGVAGFVVVSSTRFRFVAIAASRAAPVAEEHFLTDLIRVHRGRRRLRRVLFVEWRAGRTVVQLDAAQLARLEDLLQGHAMVADPPGTEPGPS